MNPTALHVAHSSGIARVLVLLAWEGSANARRLVGLWALRQASLTPVWPSFLAGPPYSYAWLSNPVIDPEFMDETAAAFVEAIARDPRLPKVLRVRYLDADCASYSALISALAERGACTTKVKVRDRPFVTRTHGVKRTGATRKKLRQDWNRLRAAGTVELIEDRSTGAVQEAFEIFLALERASWKGERGTALLSDRAEALFTRDLIAALAAEGNASVALLKLDGRAIAAQVLFYCDTTAYTWRTAFDSGFARFSPGALLVDRLTDQLFAGSGIDAIESCSPQGGFMAQIWEGRRSTVDLIADLGATQSLGFAAIAMGERSPALRERLRGASRWVKHRLPGGADAAR